jgi:predicted sugar kinase
MKDESVDELRRAAKKLRCYHFFPPTQPLHDLDFGPCTYCGLDYDLVDAIDDRLATLLADLLDVLAGHEEPRIPTPLGLPRHTQAALALARAINRAVTP